MTIKVKLDYLQLWKIHSNHSEHLVGLVLIGVTQEIDLVPLFTAAKEDVYESDLGEFRP